MEPEILAGVESHNAAGVACGMYGRGSRCFGVKRHTNNMQVKFGRGAGSEQPAKRPLYVEKRRNNIVEAAVP